MSSNTLLTPAILNSYSPKKDGSMNLTFATQELSDEQKTDVITHYQKFGWLAFRDSEDATDIDLPDEDPTREGKSQSKRLYGALYVLYTKKFPESKDFDNWRHTQMEKIIDVVKGQIDELT